MQTQASHKAHNIITVASRAKGSSKNTGREHKVAERCLRGDLLKVLSEGLDELSGIAVFDCNTGHTVWCMRLG
jgi:hypothetical protein